MHRTSGLCTKASLESISSDFQRFLPKACLQATLSPPEFFKKQRLQRASWYGKQWKEGAPVMFPDVPKLNLQRITLEGCKIESFKQILHSVTPSTASVNVHVNHEVHSFILVYTFCFRHCLPLLVEDNE